MLAHRIKDLLPLVFQLGLDGPDGHGPLEALLYLMQELHAPTEATLDDLDRFFDPRRAPESFVPYLAGWVGLDPRAVPGQLREAVARYVEVSQLRGTRLGLITVLELMTGTSGFVIDERTREDGRLRPFHIEVRAPAKLRPFEPLLLALIEREKPAFVTAALTFHAP